ncbi:unnamed protein product [Chrysodeixis includens]|uniref:Uncharacterized protein n=1 Tax=Chrysodeixis includens TaxID=689277 RepID=A0A9N8KXA5_CHRIL|nr:unnamed protein product [Chrysodeixis includens]
MIVVTCRAYFVPARRRQEGLRAYARRGPYVRRADNLDAEAQLSAESEVGGADNYDLQPSAASFVSGEGGGLVDVEDPVNPGSQNGGEAPGEIMYADPVSSEVEKTNQANTEAQVADVSQNSAEKQADKLIQPNLELQESTKLNPKPKQWLGWGYENYEKETSPAIVSEWPKGPNSGYINAPTSASYYDAYGRLVQSQYPGYNTPNYSAYPSIYKNPIAHVYGPHKYTGWGKPKYQENAVEHYGVSKPGYQNAVAIYPAHAVTPSNGYQNTLPRPRVPIGLSYYNSDAYETENNNSNLQVATQSDGTTTNVEGNELTNNQEQADSEVLADSVQNVRETTQTGVVDQLNDGSQAEEDKSFTRTRYDDEAQNFPSQGVRKYKYPEDQPRYSYAPLDSYRLEHSNLQEWLEAEANENVSVGSQIDGNNDSVGIETRFKQGYPQRNGYDHRSPKWQHG